MEFGPDATFACDLVNDEPAAAWLKEVGLEEGKFVCCIPRLRKRRTGKSEKASHLTQRSTRGTRR